MTSFPSHLPCKRYRSGLVRTRCNCPVFLSRLSPSYSIHSLDQPPRKSMKHSLRRGMSLSVLMSPMIENLQLTHAIGSRPGRWRCSREMSQLFDGRRSRITSFTTSFGLQPSCGYSLVGNLQSSFIETKEVSIRAASHNSIGSCSEAQVQLTWRLIAVVFNR